MAVLVHILCTPYNHTPVYGVLLLEVVFISHDVGLGRRVISDDLGVGRMVVSDDSGFRRMVSDEW